MVRKIIYRRRCYHCLAKMICAYVLITSRPGTEKQVVNELADHEKIKDISVVYGEYDIVAKVEAENVEALNDYLLKTLRPIAAIERTSTLIIATPNA